MKKWQCSVCGYIHEGPEPPEKCPVCGADKSKFVELVEAAPSAQGQAEAPSEAGDKQVETAADKPEAAPYQGAFDRLTDQMVKLHAHPISVHIPNGLLPVSVGFVLLAAFFSWAALGQAAFFNMVVVALAMPFVIFSGYLHWQKRLGGNLTKYIVIKMVCAGVVTVICVVNVIWAALDPTIITAQEGASVTFILLCLAMLAAAAIAGFIGGKLVFNK
jgi:hypothetical protein